MLISIKYIFIISVFILFSQVVSGYQISNNQYIQFDLEANYALDLKNSPSNKYDFQTGLNYSYKLNRLNSFVVNAYYSKYKHINNAYFNPLELIYVGMESRLYGNVYIGNTPSLFYDGFVGGWVDYEIVVDDYARYINSFSSSFGSKSVFNSILYSYRFSNMKLAIQYGAPTSEMFEDTPLAGKRKYLFGVSGAYGIGPIVFGTSFITSEHHRSILKNSDNHYASLNRTTLYNAGFQGFLGDLHIALGFFYDKNKIDLGIESKSYNLIVNYEHSVSRDFTIIPQLIYRHVDYKYYTYLSNIVRDSSLKREEYISPSIQLSYKEIITIFYEGKLYFDQPMYKEYKVQNYIGVIYKLSI